MKLFEYPYIIITIFAICFIVLGAVGLYFALQGIKAANGTREKDFSSVIKLENMFIKNGKAHRRRSLIYISVSLDNARSLYSDAKALELFARIKPILLEVFCVPDGGIASYDKTNFVALNSWSSELVKHNIDSCMKELNRCLTGNAALNVVDIRFGYYCDIISQIPFDEAIVRAKQACTMAEEENCALKEWSSKDSKALERKISIENNIEGQINNNRFFLEYQPILYSDTKKIFGAEVLSRLNSEEDGVLTPGSFLPAVQSVGITDKFDYYIFEKNCKWISNDKARRENYVYTINFSRLTLCEPEFPENITRILDKYSVKYSCVAIEILEDKALGAAEKHQMIQNLKKLKEKGISSLLDDFGSGYTSFGDLAEFNISVVKMDKKMVHAANTDSGFLILKNVINTAKALGFKTLCEGIETQEHERLAIRAGADLLQGYFYSRPISPAKLEQIFENEER